MGSSGDGSGALRKQEEARQARIREGMSAIDTTFAGYTAPFYNARAKAYQDYAMPSVADEYQQTRGSLQTGLAARGLRKSSVANRFYGALERESAKQQRGVVDAAQGEANKLRQDVENTRGNLVSQLYQTADPANAKIAATEAATRFTAPSSFAPVGNFFNDWSRVWLAGRLNNAYTPGGGTATNNTLYTAPSSGGSNWSVTN